MSGRTTHERLLVTLRKADEALPPRTLRKVLAALQAVIDPRVSEVEGGRRAHAVALAYAAAAPGERRDYWALMSDHFAADAARLKAARDHHEAAVGTPDEGQAEMKLRSALVSPRMRLLQRFAVEPEGMRFLVDLRAELLPCLKADKRLLALDAELEHLFSTWFDVAFLELRRIDWDSPASLIEKLIRYEAVHDIKGWDDVEEREAELLADDARARHRDPVLLQEALVRDEPLGRAAGARRQGDDRDLLFDQQHAGRIARRELR